MRGEKNYQISEKNLTIGEKKQDETEMHKDARLLGKNWKKKYCKLLSKFTSL